MEMQYWRDTTNKGLFGNYLYNKIRKEMTQCDTFAQCEWGSSSDNLCIWASGPQMSLPACNLGVRHPACCIFLFFFCRQTERKPRLKALAITLLPWWRGLLCFHGYARLGEAMAAGVRETETGYKRGAKQIAKEWESVRILIWSGERRERETEEWMIVWV